MTEPAVKSEPQTDPDPNMVPCSICKSEFHTTGNHHTGAPPAGDAEEPEMDPNGNHHTGDTEV